jgi:hypothetical protein
MAQSTVFYDDFSTGSDALNQTYSGQTYGSPSGAQSYTTWNIAGQKNFLPSAITTSSGGGYLRMTIGGTTSSGWGEVQALFTSSPVQLLSAGQYISLAMTFTNTYGLLNGSADCVWNGLYNANQSAPIAGLQNSGLTSATPSAYATGYAQNWKGFIGRSQMSGYNNQVFTRQPQTGAASGNQAVLGNNSSSGVGSTPTGAAVASGSNGGSTTTLTAGGVYSLLMTVTLNADGSETVANSLWSGSIAGDTFANGGNEIYSISSAEILNTSTNFVTTFDAMAFGWRHANGSSNYAPIMDISEVQVIADVPEPASAVLFGFGALALAMGYRRIRR